MSYQERSSPPEARVFSSFTVNSSSLMQSSTSLQSRGREGTRIRTERSQLPQVAVRSSEHAHQLGLLLIQQSEAQEREKGKGERGDQRNREER